MFAGRTKLAVAGLTALIMGTVLIAHPDDPKGAVKRERYEGPGYRSGDIASKSGPAVEFPASGILLRSWMPLPEFGAATSGNDCWGYVAPSGREYAIMGLSNGTAFVEITDPGTPQLLTVIAGVTSLWRDIKTYQNYAYAVTEGLGGGIQVIDLSQIDSGIVTLVNTVTQDVTDPALQTGSSHNVAIDEESGFLYRCGGGNNGLRIYSLADPANPSFAGGWADRYVHDAQVVTYTSGPHAGKQVAFVCSGLNGGSTQTGLDILDVTDKTAITTLSQLIYAGGRYSHQAWLSPDRQYLYLNDELDETGLGITTDTKVLDVSDLSNPLETATFTNGNSSIGHNLYTVGNLIFEANYRSGVRVFDATNPIAPVETEFFDTWPGNDTPAFNGLWSVYPYFPSGTFIGSDLEKGLFVWEFGQVEMAFGLPDGPPTAVPPAGGLARLQITMLNGGVLVPGSPTMHLDVGGVTTDVAMSSIGGGLYQGRIPSLECFTEAGVFFSAETTSGLKWFEPAGGASTAYPVFVSESNAPSFEDDFETPQGWLIENSVGLTTGAWARGTPLGGGDRGDPATDADGSGQCYLTDFFDGDTDVDAGSTTLRSPTFDGLDSGVAYLTYHRWFVTNGTDDGFDVDLSNDDGMTWTNVQSLTTGLEQWVLTRIRIDEHLQPTHTMRVRFTASDHGAPSLVEGGVDGLKILHEWCTKPGDATGDAVVGIDDFLLILASWGMCPPPCPADVTSDGAVGIEDFLLVLANWG